MQIIIVGIVILIAASTYCWVEIRRAYAEGKQLPRKVSVAIWFTDIIHFLLVLISSFNAIWQIPVNNTFGLIAGSFLLAGGLLMMLVGMVQFQSFRKISGLDTSKIITTGIYRWSRNPQYTGWFILLIGISLLGHSGFALLLTAVYMTGIHLYNILLEEPYLERMFGEEYKSYKSRTPRYLGIPKKMHT